MAFKPSLDARAGASDVEGAARRVIVPRVDLNAFEVTSADIDNGAGSARTIRQVYKLGLNQFSQVAASLGGRLLCGG
jgi:hypothetical protein